MSSNHINYGPQSHATALVNARGLLAIAAIECDELEADLKAACFSYGLCGDDLKADLAKVSELADDLVKAIAELRSNQDESERPTYGDNEHRLGSFELLGVR